jgi:4-hydroxy-tetrahydrodipicolinate synthase
MTIEGVIVPNLTPMDPQGERLDLDGLRQLVDFLIAKRVSALFVGGTTGEGPLLTLPERKVLLEAVVETASERVAVVAQVGTLSTQESLELAVHAVASGADAVACLTPFFFGYSERELERFFLRLAEAVAPHPLYLYNIPSRTGNALSPALAARLAETPNIVGIKDSSGDLAQLQGLLAIPGFRVLSGADHLALHMLQTGAAGFVCGPANALPEPYVALWEAWRAGDEHALLLWQRVILELSGLVRYGARIDVLKALAARRLSGIGGVRPPLAATEPEELEAIRSGLKRLLEATPLPAEAHEWL